VIFVNFRESFQINRKVDEPESRKMRIPLRNYLSRKNFYIFTIVIWSLIITESLLLFFVILGYYAIRKTFWKSRVAPIIEDIFVTRETARKGCTKTVKLLVTQYQEDRKCFRTVEKTFRVDIRPRTKSDFKVEFPGRGNQKIGMTNGDVNFIIHVLFDKEFVVNKLFTIFILSIGVAITYWLILLYAVLDPEKYNIEN
jgi:hypothetical protein